MLRSRAALLLFLAACGPSTLEIHAVGAHAASEFLKTSKVTIEAHSDAAMLAVGRQLEGDPNRDAMVATVQLRYMDVYAVHATAVAAWELWHTGLVQIAEGVEVDLGVIIEAGRHAVSLAFEIIQQYHNATGENLPEPAAYLFQIIGGD